VEGVHLQHLVSAAPINSICVQHPPSRSTLLTTTTTRRFIAGIDNDDDDDSADLSSIVQSTRRHEPTEFDQLINPRGFHEEVAAAIKDEYKKYCKQRIQPCENPLEWWEVHQQDFPHLSRMAFDLMSIPLISVECE
jgi:hypothetical protein